MDIILETIDSLLQDNRVQDCRAIINSVNDNQMANKRWLMDEALPLISRFYDPKICIAGGWFGNLAQMLYDEGFDRIWNVDVDPVCKELGSRIYPDIKHITEDINNLEMIKYDIIICTACEHIDDDLIKKMATEKKKGGLLILQSNNYFDVDGHINCKNSLQEFCDVIDADIVLAKELYIEHNDYTRYMVIAC